MESRDAVAFAQNVGVGHLITHGSNGIKSSFVPFLFESSLDGLRMIAHFARANSHHRHIAPDDPFLLVVQGPDAYVSPSLYPSKLIHGEIVPTWTYGLVHVRGTIRVVDDPVEKLRIVTRLTEHHESSRVAPWSVDDAPSEFVEKLLRAIVGLEMVVTEVSGKAKLIQDDDVVDRRAVADAFLDGTHGESEVGALMRDLLPPDS